MGAPGARTARAPAGRCHASKASAMHQMDGNQMNLRRTLAAVLFLLLLDLAAMAQTVAFKEFKLKNGLRVILSEDHSAPTYSIAVAYNAGSRDERRGQTGYAHLFEHMMFQGSQKVGKGEHM